jgi:hypothetical protein
MYNKKYETKRFLNVSSCDDQSDIFFLLARKLHFEYGFSLVVMLLTFEGETAFRVRIFVTSTSVLRDNYLENSALYEEITHNVKYASY